MNMSNILVATLGTSPGVVTEAMDLLIEQGCQPDGVILLKTQHDRVSQSYDLLLEHIPPYYEYEKNWIVPVDIESEGEDVDTPEAVKEFMQKACLVLKSHRKIGNKCFVCIAGGRKTMSALMALAVQFYGAERLFHIWVPGWIEEKGGIQKIRNLDDEEKTEWLHPNKFISKEEDRPKIVDLQFLGIFPLLPKIVAALKGEPSDSDTRAILVSNGFLDARGKASELGQHFIKTFESIEHLPPMRREKCIIQISDRNKYKDWIKKLAQRLEIKFGFIEKIEDIDWKQTETKVVSVPPDKLNIMWIEGKSVKIGLQLATTSTTEGELKAVRKVVEEYISKILY